MALDFWLVATLLFANFASAIAEARGKAQADALRKTRRATPARRFRADGTTEQVASTELRAGDKVEVVAGDVVPGDGEIIEGVASIDESAITGESAPVIREAGGDRSGVTGGTRVLSDRIVVEITASPGGSFLDRMIALVEGAIRQRTPNEIALSVVLAVFTLIFLIVTATLWPIAYNVELYMKDFTGQSISSLGTDVPTLVALLVCLIPTTIGALLAAIGIAGMDRALRANIMAKSGKAVEVAGDVDTLLLDKTGTITVGNRRATQFVPFDGFTAAEVGRLAAQASAADQTPEGKSIVELFHQAGGPIGAAAGQNVRKSNGDAPVPAGSRFVPFTAQTRMSGIDLAGWSADSQRSARRNPPPYQAAEGNRAGLRREHRRLDVASKGATPLLVSEGCRIAGMVVLEDILKPGIAERFERLRRMGLRTVMVTGDNPLTAKAIAEAGRR